MTNILKFPSKKTNDVDALDKLAPVADALIDPTPRADSQVDLSRNLKGDLYDDDKDVADIAKETSKHLRTQFKGYKFSVRISRFSMGQSITVSLLDIPDTTPLFCKDYEYALLEGTQSEWSGSWRSNSVNTLLDAAKRYLDRHNRDLSDVSTDYHNVKFFAHVTVDASLYTARADLIKAARAVDLAEQESQTVEDASSSLTLSHVQHAAQMLGLRVREHEEQTQWSLYQPANQLELIRGDVSILAAFLCGMLYQTDRR